MLKRIKQALAVIGMKPIPKATDWLLQNTYQEDEKLQELRKRINQQFDAQQTLLNARAMRPHGIDCTDELTCSKDPCWVWEPDKIVSPVYLTPNKRYKDE